MDCRLALSPNSVLHFPGMDCVIEACVGRGSNALVYKAWYADAFQSRQRHEVLIKELYPNLPGGLLTRGDSGELLGMESGNEQLEAHRKSFALGNEMHLKMLRAHPEIIGANLNTFACQGTLYTVLGYTGGRTLQSALTEPVGLRTIAERMLGVLDALDVFHTSGYLHLDVSPDNLILYQQGQRECLLLIDYNSMVPLHHAQEDLLFSCKEGYTAPEVFNGFREEIGIPSDLFAVGAVFYTLLTGERLSVMQLLSASAPELRESELLQNAPETVRSMVRQILRKSLHPLPKRRYASCRAMREAFEELLNRIDGVGVTHAAIWEKERARMERLLRRNPSLQYLKEPEELFPMQMAHRGEKLDSRRLSDWLGLQQGRLFLLKAWGGMGKTTALMSLAIQSGLRYHPKETVAVYIAVSDLRSDTPYPIRDRLLQALRFRADMTSYESARHELDQVLSRPLQSREGLRPAFLLLIDGVNEAGDRQDTLLRECRELARMPGVRLLCASRTEEKLEDAQKLELLPLDEDTIRLTLGRNGLLMPEKPEMRELLSTPLLLSLFLQTARCSGCQSSAASEAELLSAYLDALLEKEKKETGETSDESYRLACALDYVLPTLAAASEAEGRPLTEAEMLRLTERCYRVIRARDMVQAFPQWVGCSHAILGACRNAEEWYGEIVRGLLWQRMGLLVRDTDGRFRIFHARVAEWLLDVDRDNRKRIAGRRSARLRILSGAAAVLLLLLAMAYRIWIYVPKYDAALLETTVLTGVGAYSTYGNLFSTLEPFLQELSQGGTAVSPVGFTAVRNALESADRRAAQESAMMSAMLHELYESGEAAADTGQAFEEEAFLALGEELAARTAYYRGHLAALEVAWSEDQAAGAKAAEELLEVLHADAYVLSDLYELSCAKHDLDPADSEEAARLLAYFTALQSYREPMQQTEGEQRRQELYQRHLYTRKEAERAVLADPVFFETR